MSEKSKPHGIQLLIRTLVKDANGKVLSDSGQKPSKSFVIQFLEMLHLLFDGPYGEHDRTQVDGSEDEMYEHDRPATYYWQANAAVNTSVYGIVVGTGDTASTNIDYALETQLTEGVGGGQITHGQSVVEAPAVVGANVDMEMYRAFTNNTGSSITVKEAGLYTRHRDMAQPFYFCNIRDVLGTPVAVPDKCSLTVFYTLRTTV